MKKLPRPIGAMLRDRLDKTPPDQKPAKLLQLQITELLVRSGELGLGTALAVAERLCKDQPRMLAELLHQISNSYLSEQDPPVQP